MAVAGMGGLAGPGEAEEKHTVALGIAIRLLSGNNFRTGVQAEQSLFLGVPHCHPEEAHLHLTDIVDAENHREVLLGEHEHLAFVFRPFRNADFVEFGAGRGGVVIAEGVAPDAGLAGVVSAL